MLIYDTHVHTECSLDAEHSVTYVGEKAEERGLAGIAVTDHCEIEKFREQQYYHKVTQSMFHALLAKGIFQDRLKVLCGVEIGQPLVNTEYVQQVLDLKRFDYVLGSLHSIDGVGFYFADFSEVQVDIPALLNHYYEELCRMLEWGKFDALAHLTYPFRYIRGDYKLPYTEDMFQKQIDEVLRLCIEKGKALEINTSGLRQNIGECLPNLDIARRYRAMGGELVTLGSDSHSAFTVGDGIEQGAALLREAGFTHYFYYEDRKPVAVALA